MTTPPTLTSNAAMGGLRAKAGFGYQTWDALMRLPRWLKNPSFEGVILEGLEDTEARFFAPHAPQGHLLDRFQAKSGVLTKAEIAEVIDNFKAFADAYPGVARVQTLVTPQLPATLAWVANDPERVRRARPFFAPFSQITSASDTKVADKFVKEFGAEIGSFFASTVEVDVRAIPDAGTIDAALAFALNAAFPKFDLGARKAAEVFGSLMLLAEKSPGVMLTRGTLIKHLSATLGEDLGLSESLRVHVRSDRNAEEGDAVEIDAVPFSGVNGEFPASEVWQSKLLTPLDRTAKWARANGYQRISLSGSFRLSTAFALGNAFRSATGFDINIPTRDTSWSTEERPLPDNPPPVIHTSAPSQLRGDRLIVSVGIIRDPSADVRAYLSVGQADVLSMLAPAPVTDGKAAQSLVAAVKTIIGETVGKLRPTIIDLFFVGPAAFAVAFGHRWNALPPTQLYEFDKQSGSYVPTCLIV